jgi:mycofactocin precursor peptide peptidase
MVAVSARHGLGHLTSPQVPERTTLLLPLGSTEQHGPHLPAGTDAFVAEAVAAGVAELAEGSAGHPVVVAPTLGYGASGEHEHFAGTISIGHQALALVLLELGRSACLWAGRLLVVNAHGGNLPTVRDTVQQLRDEDRDVAWVPCARPGADPHAGRFETSLMLAIAPWSVRMTLARAGATEPIEVLLPRLRQSGVRSVSASGVLGDPTQATAREGRELLRAITEDVAERLLRWSPDAAGMLTPALPQPAVGYRT